MNAEHDILECTGWSSGGRGELPIRLTICKFNGEFVTAYENEKGMFFEGHYFRNILSAARDYVRRIDEHNKSFGKSISAFSEQSYIWRHDC